SVPIGQELIAGTLLADGEHVYRSSECPKRSFYQRHRQAADRAILLYKAQQCVAAVRKGDGPSCQIRQAERRRSGSPGHNAPSYAASENQRRTMLAADATPREPRQGC